jgi:Na+-transporting NADH:ubiquinone oxidoreductase subunit NqrC
MYQTEADFREERTRRLLYILLGVSLFISAAICGVLLILTLSQSDGQRLLGNNNKFQVGQVAEVPVKRLELTKILPNTPKWSEDIIFVVKQPDNTYQAFLSLDPVTGCKLNWREQQDEFVDDCSRVRYTLSGRNATSAMTLAAAPQHMIEMPVEVQGEDVYVIDRMVRRSAQ